MIQKITLYLESEKPLEDVMKVDIQELLTRAINQCSSEKEKNLRNQNDNGWKATESFRYFNILLQKNNFIFLQSKAVLERIRKKVNNAKDLLEN